MEKPDRRPLSLAGLGLISAGAVLGLALATPASAAPTSDPKPPASPSAPGPQVERP
ncbi:hypothetical protein GCM10010172_12720 [Paractinoplanes ferrugineus]|uniref:Uncharacterized protein n=1 Tax=Paractinoplanes ferrugineus TaxID=113564 RepID=A0A919IXN7_9ACTN|nr:hypothetical protein Afe05nite_16770 [Actinoplanes ferrugineus]